MSERREGGGGGREREKGRTYLLTRKRERRGERDRARERGSPSIASWLGFRSCISPVAVVCIGMAKGVSSPRHTIHKDEATKKGVGIEEEEEAAKVNFEETAKSG